MYDAIARCLAVAITIPFYFISWIAGVATKAARQGFSTGERMWQ